MRKIVICRSYGGFMLSDEAMQMIRDLKKKIEMPVGGFHDEDVFEPDQLEPWDLQRDDPHLVEVVEKLGIAAQAGGEHTTLKIVEIPDDVKWEIESTDGLEWVSEVHRTWY